MTFVIASAVVAMVTGSARVGLDTSDISRVLRLCSESCKASEEAQSVSMVDSAWQKLVRFRKKLLKHSHPPLKPGSKLSFRLNLDLPVQADWGRRTLKIRYQSKGSEPM